MNATKFSVGILLAGIALYAALIMPFSDYLRRKPVEEKLGYIPNLRIVRLLSCEQKELAAASLLMKVIMYFGGVVMKQEESAAPPSLEYAEMEKSVWIALKLDPYNMDGYYFAQSVLVWDLKEYRLVNDLLDYGMKYRTWDGSLPFFAGFNSAYFMKDYASAARYYQRAGELSGSDLSKLLAGRYMQESGETELAIAYLTAMVNGERNQALKKTYLTRLEAFREVRRIEVARDQYREKTGKLPSTVEQLLREGFLAPSPVDPYGGRFYLKRDGKVATTSRFSTMPTGMEQGRQRGGE